MVLLLGFLTKEKSNNIVNGFIYFNNSIGANKKNIESIENTKIRNHLKFVNW